MINCANPGPDMEPCGQCESCISFQEGRSYCIHEMDAASNNSVDDIKALMDQVQVPPQVGKYSVYIIDEVHMLSQSAFNAFLKTLEEPPAHAIFILATTEKHKILPTILSRCQTYDFNRISIPDIVRNLRDIAVKEGVTIDDESLHVIAMKADGAMRDALTIFDQTVAFCGTTVQYEDVIRNLNVLDYEYSFSLVDNFLAGDYGKALLTFDEVLSKGFNALHFVAALSAHLRDLVVARTAGLEALLELPDSLKKRYQEQAARASLPFLFEALSITTACEAGYRTAVNPRLHIEFALMRLAYANAKKEAPAPADAATAPAQRVSGGSASLRAAPTPAGVIGKADNLSEATPSVPKPDVAASAVTEPAPTRRRAAKTGASLSISSLLQEKQEATKEAEEAAKANEAPSDERIREVWATLPEVYKSRPRLANMLSSVDMKVEAEDDVRHICFDVASVAQQDWIEKNLRHDIEGTLARALNYGRIKLRVGLLPQEEQPKKAYLPEEKARELIAKNPELRKLVDDLNLDVK